MRIIKCDICKKTINSLDEKISLGINKYGLYSTEICFNCGKSIIKLLKDKKLIKEDGKKK